MTPDQKPTTSAMTTRQKITAAILAIIVIVIAWQIYGLFAPDGATTETITPVANKTPAAGPIQQSGPIKATGPQTAMSPVAPVAQVARPMQPQVSPQEAELQRLQQLSQSEYISAVNQLQKLKIERDIAETNKAIMTAQLDIVTAQKGIVDLLSPPAPPPAPATYAQGLGGTPVPVGVPQQVSAQPVVQTTVTSITPEVNYSVISVSRLQNKWMAVLGYQGSLYSVAVGDILPPDRSTVVSIGRTGVLLEKDGTRKKVSLVPII